MPTEGGKGGREEHKNAANLWFRIFFFLRRISPTRERGANLTQSALLRGQAEHSMAKSFFVLLARLGNVKFAYLRANKQAWEEEETWCAARCSRRRKLVDAKSSLISRNWNRMKVLLPFYSLWSWKNDARKCVLGTIHGSMSKVSLIISNQYTSSPWRQILRSSDTFEENQNFSTHATHGFHPTNSNHQQRNH